MDAMRALERAVAGLPGVRGARAETSEDGVAKLLVLVVPERANRHTLETIQALAPETTGAALDPERIEILSVLSAGGAEVRPSRRRLASLVIERAGELFTAKVSLDLAGDVLVGQGTCACVRRLEHRAVAEATLEASSDLVDAPAEVESVDIVQVGEARIATVLLRRDPGLGFAVGSAVARLDDYDAIARATLDAVNRSFSTPDV
ncbi:MAG: hypothetical protein H0V97_00490 [Actinobacteria bacterium]|nr:hypothetical protein [Actinomycetota bacterium]